MKAEFNWKTVFFTCLVGLACWLALFSLVSCETTAGGYGMQHYYNYDACPWMNGWVEILNQKANIYEVSAEAVRKEAWNRHAPLEALALTWNWTTVMAKGWQPDTLFHEASHLHDFYHGRGGHNAQCWVTTRPQNYDEIVLKAIIGINVKKM